MCLLVNNFKIIGMLLNIVHDQLQKKLSKTYNKGFPNHSTLINYVKVSQNTLATRSCKYEKAGTCIEDLPPLPLYQW